MTQQNLFDEHPTPAPRVNERPADARYTWFFALRPVFEDSWRIHTFADKLLIANGVTGKRITPDRLHITLELIGHDSELSVIDTACRAADAIQASPFTACFDSVMTFAGSTGALVLVGTDGLTAVHKLRTALACSMANCGFRPRRGYVPHMTLCYDENHQLPRMSVEPISFAVTEFALIKSHVGLSRHEVVRTWRLTDLDG